MPVFSYRAIDRRQAAVGGSVAADSPRQAYKQANRMVTGTTRSTAARSQYLRSLVDDYRTPSSLKPWLEKGKVPPGYGVEHIKPLSIGGPDTPANMRLQGADLHGTHHRYYRPWE